MTEPRWWGVWNTQKWMWEVLPHHYQQTARMHLKRNSKHLHLAYRGPGGKPVFYIESVPEPTTE